jgi:hypothetical protein
MNIEFRLYRWGSAMTSFIFLILASHLQYRLNNKRQKSIAKARFRSNNIDSSMKRIYSTEGYKVNESNDNSREINIEDEDGGKLQV